MTITEMVNRRDVPLPIFTFEEPGAPCTYWKTTGSHTVSDGLCRCGKRFVISEVLR
jgi:hypothetical protein